MSRKIAVSGRKTIAGTEYARSCRSQFAGAVSFEDAKKNMEAALQAHIEGVLRKHSRAGRKKVA
jgi:hypothetical protein